MKRIILILCFFNLVHAFAQPSGKKYTFDQIGWSIILPGDFTAFPSAEQSIQIQPGKKADKGFLSKRLIMAMKDANTFSVSLSSCDLRDENASDVFSAANRQSYAGSSKEEGIKCDSATTTVSIDGVSFKRYSLTTKKNNLIKNNYITLFTCYKGYSIYITLLYYSKNAGEELESMLEHSKFIK